MKDKNVIVHVKNEQEWDVIKKECNPNSAMYTHLWAKRTNTEKETGIHISDNSNTSLDWFKQNKPQIPIISFEEYQTEYIVGKWYKFKRIGPKSYAKFSHIFSDRKPEVKDFWFTECINDGGYRVKNDWWSESHKPTLVTDLSEIQEFLPNGHEDKEGVEYKFPEKWCIRQNASQKACDWFNKQGNISSAKIKGAYTYLVNRGDTYSYSIPEGYTEITAEQFEKYVLNGSEVKEWQVDTYVVAIKDGHANTQPQDAYKIGFCNKITHVYDNRCEIIGLKFSLYVCNKSDFKWFATLEEAEKFSKTLTKKEEVKEFKKGEYIVTLDKNSAHLVGSVRENYCFKQRVNDSYLQNEIDATGSKTNGNTGVTPLTNNWRYATKEEAAEYERVGKPYDVTTLNNNLLVNGEYYFVKENQHEWIIKCIDNTLEKGLPEGQHNIKKSINIKITDSSFYESHGLCYLDRFRTYRKATQKEINWLDACIKANEFVEKPVTNQNLCIGGTDVAYSFKEGSNTIYLMGSNMHPSNEGFQSLRYYNNLPNSISVKVRNKKPETQTVSKRVKLNFQINKSTLKIKVRNDK